MLLIPHALAGAAVAGLLRRPALAYPAAVASHLVLDVVPHLDSHGLFGAPQGGPTPLEATAGVLDFLVACALMLWLVRGRADRRLLLGGAFCGMLIDLVNHVPPWGPWFSAWPGTAWLSDLHAAVGHGVQPAQWPLGVGTQVVTVALSLWVILRAGRRAPA